MTKPLTSPDCDLRDTKYMPLYVQQMLNSSFNSMLDDTAWRAGVTLWLKSWHQLPAGSLPDADDDLVGLAGFGRDVKSWRKVRDKSLRGWVRCDDGRLYHPLIAEAALEAWISRLLGQISSGAGNARKWGIDFDPSLIEQQIEASYPLLAGLNPKSETVKKLDRRKAQSDPDKKPAAKPKRTPSGIPDVIPPGPAPGSQGKGEGKGTTGESISIETLSPSVAGVSAAAPPEKSVVKFPTFFNGYPNKAGMLRAEEVWIDLVAEGVAPADIVAGMVMWVEKWRRDGTLTRDGGRWIPNSATWLEDRRWLDPIEAPAPAATWSGPEAFREAIEIELRERGLREDEVEGWVRSYLAPAKWSELAPDQIIASTKYAAGMLRGIGRLKSYTIRVEEARAA